MAQPDETPSRITVLGVVAVLFAATCWATSGIFVKLIQSGGPISSLLLAFWRDTFAFIVFFALSLSFSRHQLKIKPADRIWLAGMGISLGVFHVFLNLGYRLNGAAITTIQQAAMPAIVLVAARIIWNEPLTRQKSTSLLLICLGTVLISGLLQTSVREVSASHIVAGFLVPALYAGWGLFGKALRSEYDAMTTLTWAFGIAAIILLPCQFLAGRLLPSPQPTISYLWFTGLILISTVAGFLAFIYALGRLPASVATIIVMSEIAVAVTLAHILFGESLSPADIGGALLIVTGVILTAWRQTAAKQKR